LDAANIDFRFFQTGSFDAAGKLQGIQVREIIAGPRPDSISEEQEMLFTGCTVGPFGLCAINIYAFEIGPPSPFTVRTTSLPPLTGDAQLTLGPDGLFGSLHLMQLAATVFSSGLPPSFDRVQTFSSIPPPGTDPNLRFTVGSDGAMWTHTVHQTVPNSIGSAPKGR
jgi:hypothetical protein